MSADQRSAERRGRLSAAAVNLFGTAGYASTSIEQICAKANVSTRSFYVEIGGMEALLLAVVEDIAQRSTTAAVAELARLRDETLQVRVRSTFHAYLEVTCADSRTARVCYVEVVGVSAAVETWRQGWRHRIAGVLVAEAERAVERGEAHPRDFRLFALGIVGAVNSMAQEWVLHNGPDSPPSGATLGDVADELAHLAMAAIAPR